MASTKWSPAELFPETLRYVLERFSPGHYLGVIIDQSTLAGKWEVLWASIPLRGRALPIAFRLFRYEDIAEGRERSQNTIEEALVRQVVAMLPDPAHTILLFDRGYARVSLFRLLDRLGVRYVVRVKRNVWVGHQRHTGCLREVCVAKGVQEWWPGVRYHQTARYRVNLVISRNATAEEPRYLVTNLSRAQTAVRHYECPVRGARCASAARSSSGTWRQQPAEGPATPGDDPPAPGASGRVQKLLLGMPALERDEGSALYDALTLLGAQVQRRGLRRKVSKDKASLAFLALRTLQMSWLLTYERIVQALFHSRWSLGYESG